MITMEISFGECTEHNETDLWQYGILHAIKQTIFRRLDLDPIWIHHWGPVSIPCQILKVNFGSYDPDNSIGVASNSRIFTLIIKDNWYWNQNYQL